VENPKAWDQKWHGSGRDGKKLELVSGSSGSTGGGLGYCAIVANSMCDGEQVPSRALSKSSGSLLEGC